MPVRRRNAGETSPIQGNFAASAATGVVSFHTPVPANSRKSRTWAVQRAMVSPLPGFGFVMSHLRADPGDDVLYGVASRFARPEIAEPARGCSARDDTTVAGVHQTGDAGLGRVVPSGGCAG